MMEGLMFSAMSKSEFSEKFDFDSDERLFSRRILMNLAEEMRMFLSFRDKFWWRTLSWWNLSLLFGSCEATVSQEVNKVKFGEFWGFAAAIEESRWWRMFWRLWKSCLKSKTWSFYVATTWLVSTIRFGCCQATERIFLRKEIFFQIVLIRRLPRRFKQSSKAILEVKEWFGVNFWQNSEELHLNSSHASILLACFI